METFISFIVAIILVLLIIFLLPESCRPVVSCSSCTSCTSDTNTGDNNDGTGNNDNNDNNGDNGNPSGPSEGTGDTDVNITTGKVKVDILNLKFESVVGKKLMFEGETEDEPVLFQPGDVYYTEGFKIKNNGTVKISYKMFITAKDEIDMVKFTDAFEFYITTDPNNLSGAIKMLEFNGTLDPSMASTTFYVVVAMKIEAGNEFQDLTFNGIGITVNASQVLEGN